MKIEMTLPPEGSEEELAVLRYYVADINAILPSLLTAADKSRQLLARRLNDAERALHESNLAARGLEKKLDVMTGRLGDYERIIYGIQRALGLPDDAFALTGMLARVHQLAQIERNVAGGAVPKSDPVPTPDNSETPAGEESTTTIGPDCPF